MPDWFTESVTYQLPKTKAAKNVRPQKTKKIKPKKKTTNNLL